MATLDCLKAALHQASASDTTSITSALSHEDYAAGFKILSYGSRSTYEDFIIPQFTDLVASANPHLSVLEIGPGPKSLFASLPGHLTRSIARYTAYEPNPLYVAELEKWLTSTDDKETGLPCLRQPGKIIPLAFTIDVANEEAEDDHARYDIILFCHSMYGMNPKHRYLKHALKKLRLAPSGVLVVFHRESLCLDGLVCQRTVSLPTGLVRVPNDNESLHRFASYIAGRTAADNNTRAEWQRVCRALGSQDAEFANYITFMAPEVLMVFNKHATALPKLAEQVPIAWKERRVIKNPEARKHSTVPIAQPTEIQHVQDCVKWALDHHLNLTVIGGSHSGHCLRSNVLAVDMRAFDHISTFRAEEQDRSAGCGSLMVVEAGCKTEDIIQEGMRKQLTIPLGSRPSVGAGLWLQGGIGHLARSHGLTCDSIVGAIMVSVENGDIQRIGHVPSECCPAGAIVPENAEDLLWALKGAGNNFGVVMSVCFRAWPEQFYRIYSQVLSLKDISDGERELAGFAETIVPRVLCSDSVDAYIYWDEGDLKLGIAHVETATSKLELATPTIPGTFSGKRGELGKVVDGIELFEHEPYVSGMHGGHAGGKTSAFKRCVFLKCIGDKDVTSRLMSAVVNRPTDLSYLHLLHAGGAVNDVAPEATAFGCRNWEYACVVTGVWPRDDDGGKEEAAAVAWVYAVARALLPYSQGVYGADLGPDPRDAKLATKAFGLNGPRLARFKSQRDPKNILAYSCPLSAPSIGQRVVLTITGPHGVGKDHSASVWARYLNQATYARITTRLVSISDVTKHEYAAQTRGVDLQKLLHDRKYKEEHREALTTFYKAELKKRANLPEEHFVSLVNNARNVDVVLITGMRDVAPVAAYSRLIPDCKMIEVNVTASDSTLQNRRGRAVHPKEKLTYQPSLAFNNDKPGNVAIRHFADKHLIPLLDRRLEHLSALVHTIPDFPRHSIDFRHVLGLTHERGGLKMATSLLQGHFPGDWSGVDAIVGCEAGGFIFASALALQTDVPLILVREQGKLPPPTVAVAKPRSNVSSAEWDDALEEKKIEIGLHAISAGAKVVIVDDVLATGRTLLAVLQLLIEVGVKVEDVTVLVVVEFPVHKGRKLLLDAGFGMVNVRSLLVYGGE